MLPEREITVNVDELADSSVVLVVKFWAKKENYWQARYTMLEDIKYGFDEAGIRIPVSADGCTSGVRDLTYKKIHV